jgi:chemotaxis protein MotB
MAGTGENFQLTKENMGQLKEQLQKSIQSITDLEKLKKNIEMTVTSEGLRIELLESAGGTFFDSGSATLNTSGQELLTLLAAELGKVPNHISVEGHTDAKPLYRQEQLQQLGTLGRPGERGAAIDATVGTCAAIRSRKCGALRTSDCAPKDPLDPSNRRVSIIVQYLSSNSDEAEPPVKDAKESGEKPSAAGAKPESETKGKKDERSKKRPATKASPKNCICDANNCVIFA